MGMRACQDLQTPTKKPGFYLISGLQSTIVLKNPVSGSLAIGFLGGWAIGFLGGWAIGFFVDGRSVFFVDGRSGFWWMGDRVFGWMGAIGF